jgi:hypothetical protein
MREIRYRNRETITRLWRWSVGRRRSLHVKKLDFIVRAAKGGVARQDRVKQGKSKSVLNVERLIELAS